MQLVVWCLLGPLILTLGTASDSMIYENCDATTGKCQKVKCTTVNDCTSHSSNTVCTSGYCTCKDGHSQQNTECTQVLGRTCVFDIDCDVDNAICSDDHKCSCESNWYENNGQCVPYIGKTCTMVNDCLNLKGTDQNFNAWMGCIDGTCDCTAGYRNVAGTCTQILWSRCQTDNDCSMERAYCYKYRSSYSSGHCECSPGASYLNGQCVYRLGRSCSGIYDCTSYNHMSCDLDNICRCMEGMIEADHECVQVYNRPCASDDDCGDGEAYNCSTDGKCVCADDYVLSDIDGISVCNPAMTKCVSDGDCPMENSACGLDNICDCNDGYFYAAGSCKPVLGISCFRDERCQLLLRDTRCGHNNLCECVEGYIQQNRICTKVLQSACKYHDECTQAVSHASCSEGTCQCDYGYDEINGRCLRGACAVAVPVLPALHHRGRIYSVDKAAIDPLCDDSAIHEGWYSTSIYSLSTSSIKPKIGQCGTYYPIYLQSELMTDEKTRLASGDEVQTTAVVGDVLETISIRLRKCGDDIHVYVTPPATKMSCLCIERTLAYMSTSSAKPYMGGSFSLSAKLQFQQELRNGKLWHIPKLVFIPKPMNIDQRYWYLINWYAKSQHFLTLGPVSGRLLQQDFNLLAITEKELKAHGFSAGVDLQASLQAMDLDGRISGEVYGNTMYTGIRTLYDTHTIYATAKKHTPLQVQHTPLGCASADDDDTETCSLLFKATNVNGVDTCSDGIQGTRKHPLCGLALLGVTHKSLSKNPYNEYSRKNGKSSNRYSGTYIALSPNGIYDFENIRQTKLQKGPVTQHTFWTEYVPPDIYVRIGSSSMVESWFSCGVYTERGASMFMTTSANWMSIKVPLLAVGEFIALHDKTRPFQVQIKTEECQNSLVSSGVCVCAVTFRYGNSIYTKGMCGGIKREGMVFGDDIMDPFTGRISPFVNFNLQLPVNSGLLGMHIDRRYGNASIEGLCAAESGLLLTRWGERSSDWTDFMESWKVPFEESLLNSANYRDYAWTDNTYMCWCPEESDHIPSRIYTSQRATYEAYYEHKGAIKCSLDAPCSTSHLGRIWPQSLLLTTYIEQVTVAGRMENVQSKITISFTCNFQTEHGYFYVVQWLVDNQPIKSSATLSADDATMYTLTRDEIQTFFLDSEVKCGVTLKDSSNKTLMTKHSKPFVSVQPSTTEINIIRGGEATISLALNLQRTCGGDCTWEITFFDMDDEDCKCQDSTIAVKTKDNVCGTRIPGVSSVPLSKDIHTVSQTSEEKEVRITTKNNKKYSLKTVFKVQMRSRVQLNGRKYLQEEFRNVISMFVRDEGLWMRKVCYCNNDPRIKTFDGRYLYLAPVGNFVLYRHRNYPAEVQIITKLCNGMRATCSCGVIIRAGQDVYIINHCKGHQTGWLMKGPASRTLIVYEIQKSHRYQFNFPHGTIVDVSVSRWKWFLVNVNIYASPADVNNVEGLCGYFNGNNADDFRLREGGHDDVKPTNRWWWWYYVPQEFPLSWSLNNTRWEHEMLTKEANLDNLPQWPQDDVLCVCNGDHYSENSICSANEEDTCTQAVDAPGIEVSRTSRVKRADDADVSLDADMRRRLRELHSFVLETHMTGISKRSTDENRMLDDDAMAKCQIFLERNCPAYKMKDDLEDALPADFNGTLMNCALDTAINKDVTWGGESCARQLAILQIETKRDTAFKDDNTAMVEQINDKCVGNCSGNGVCMKGKCLCNPGYSNSMCAVTNRIPPRILRVYGHGTCDKKMDGSCLCIHITTDGNADSTMCRIIVLEATRKNNKFVTVRTFEVAAVVENNYEVYCCVESHVRRKRSTSGQSSPIGQSYQMSLSNDNATYGDSQYVFVLDSTCQEIQNDTDGVKLLLKSGFCYIGGVCYGENSTSGAGCAICNTSYSHFDWDDTCLTSGNSVASSDDKTLAIVVSVAAGVAALILIGVFVSVVVIAQKNTVVVPSPRLYNTPKYDAGKETFMARPETNKNEWM